VIKRKTVFVLGAGASCEFGFPAGDKLAAIIAKVCDLRWEDQGAFVGEGDKFLSRLGIEQNELEQAGQLIRRGVAGSRSIDEFLEGHASKTSVQILGKAAIVQTVLAKERASSLWLSGKGRDEWIDMLNPDITSTWLTKLYRHMSANVVAGDLSTMFENVTFVTFNYDRIVEQFFYHMVLNQHGDAVNLNELSEHLKILHVYGSVGDIDAFPGPDIIPFGTDARDGYFDLRKLQSRIRIYTETFADKKMLEQIHAAMRDADQIFFLGFAYHEPNMNILKPAGDYQKTTKIFGTIYEMPGAIEDFVTPSLRLLLNPDVQSAGVKSSVTLERKTCADMIDAHYLNLTR
jgi:hypothetical protein